MRTGSNEDKHGNGVEQFKHVVLIHNKVLYWQLVLLHIQVIESRMLKEKQKGDYSINNTELST
jgi:hypothetical protein